MPPSAPPAPPPPPRTSTTLQTSLTLTLLLTLVTLFECPSIRSPTRALVLTAVLGLVGEGVRRVGWTEGGLFPNWKEGQGVDGGRASRGGGGLPGSLNSEQDLGNDDASQGEDGTRPNDEQHGSQGARTAVNRDDTAGSRTTQRAQLHQSQQTRQRARPAPPSTSTLTSIPDQGSSAAYSRPPLDSSTSRERVGTKATSGSKPNMASGSGSGAGNTFRSAFERQYDPESEPETESELETEHEAEVDVRGRQDEQDEGEDVERSGSGSGEEVRAGIMEVDSPARDEDQVRTGKSRKRALSIASSVNSSSDYNAGATRGGGGKRRQLRRNRSARSPGANHSDEHSENGNQEDGMDFDEEEEALEELDQREDGDMSVEDTNEHAPYSQSRAAFAGKKRDMSEADLETESVSSGRRKGPIKRGRKLAGDVSGGRKVSGLRNERMQVSGEEEDEDENERGGNAGSAGEEDSREMDVDSASDGHDSESSSDIDQQDDHELDSDGDLLPPRLRHAGSSSSTMLQTSQSRIQLRPSSSSASLRTRRQSDAAETASGRKKTSRDQAARTQKAADIAAAKAKAQSASHSQASGSRDRRQKGNGSGRKAGEHWSVGGVRYRMERDGTITRSVEIKDWRPKFKMPKDSKHPDAQVLHLVIKEVWYTDEQYEAAKQRRELAGQSSDEETHAKHVPPAKPAPVPLPRNLYHLQSSRSASQSGAASPRPAALGSSLSDRISTPTRRVLSMSTSRNGSRSSSATGTPARATTALPPSTPSILGGASMKLAQSQALDSSTSSTSARFSAAGRPSGLGASGSGSSSPVPQKRTVTAAEVERKEKMILERLRREGAVSARTSVVEPVASAVPTPAVAASESTGLSHPSFGSNNPTLGSSSGLALTSATDTKGLPAPSVAFGSPAESEADGGSIVGTNGAPKAGQAIDLTGVQPTAKSPSPNINPSNVNVAESAKPAAPTPFLFGSSATSSPGQLPANHAPAPAVFGQSGASKPSMPNAGPPGFNFGAPSAAAPNTLFGSLTASSGPASAAPTPTAAAATTTTMDSNSRPIAGGRRSAVTVQPRTVSDFNLGAGAGTGAGVAPGIGAGSANPFGFSSTTTPTAAAAAAPESTSMGFSTTKQPAPAFSFGNPGGSSVKALGGTSQPFAFGSNGSLGSTGTVAAALGGGGAQSGAPSSSLGGGGGNAFNFSNGGNVQQAGNGSVPSGFSFGSQNGTGGATSGPVPGPSAQSAAPSAPKFSFSFGKS